jgi:transcriptional regulator with XRE-family HTH domain
MTTNVSAAQVRAACALLGISQAELARRAGVGTSTVEVALAKGTLRDLKPDTLAKVLRVFTTLEFRDGGVMRRPGHHFITGASE